MPRRPSSHPPGRAGGGIEGLFRCGCARLEPQLADIAADYELSTERLRPRYAAAGIEDRGPQIQRVLARQGTTARDVLLTTLAGLDVAAYLRSAGMRDVELAAVRDRLLEPAS